MSELKSCPFCGRKLKIIRNTFSEYQTVGRAVYCLGCGIRFFVPWAVTDDQVITAMNRRAET